MSEFKNIDELMKEYQSASEKYPVFGRDSYMLGRLEIAYSMLHNEYLRLTKNKTKNN